MNNFKLEIWDDEASLCTFYTVKWLDAELSETEKFFQKYENIPEYFDAINEMMDYVINIIGEKYGAIPELFNRYENEVVGLPLHGKVTLSPITLHYPQFPLRLYALRIQNRTDLVVLFNGGPKTADTNQESTDLSMKWREACKCARIIETAIRDGMIEIDETNRRLKSFNDEEDIIL